MNHPITIVGGGLAGLSLAAGLRLLGVPVTVHEAGAYPRHRVCGEFLSGVRPETLAALGIDDCLEGARSHRTVRWVRAGKPLREYSLPDAALAISRNQLDTRLCRRARALGADVMEHSRVPRQARSGMVWAAGRIPRAGSWIGLKCHVTGGMDLTSDLEMHLGSNGYVGLAGIEDDRINVCGLFRLERSRGGHRGALLLSYLRAGGHEKLARQLEAADVDQNSFCAVAGFGLGWQQDMPDHCVIGDAEAMIPPFTGNGMSMAFQSAGASVELLADWSRGECSWDECRFEIRQRLQSMFRRRMAVSGAMNPFLVHPRAQKWMAVLTQRGWLPLQPLLALIR